MVLCQYFEMFTNPFNNLNRKSSETKSIIGEMSRSYTIDKKHTKKLYQNKRFGFRFLVEVATFVEFCMHTYFRVAKVQKDRNSL